MAPTPDPVANPCVSNTRPASSIPEQWDDAALALADLVHRLRQSLSTIETCVFYLGMVLPEGDERCLDQVQRIEHQIAEAGRILMEAAHTALLHQAARGAAESRSLTKDETAVVT